jgi:hypothetical protein
VSALSSLISLTFFSASVIENGSNFATGVVDTGVVSTDSVPFLLNIHAIFRKKSENKLL